MFTVAQIHAAHDKVKSGADFPAYIGEIKTLGVTGFATWVKDSHTEYFGANDYRTQSAPMYATLTIADNPDATGFEARLKAHQQGTTDYLTFCRDCAETGIEKWIVDLSAMTCIYYDKKGNEVLVETIPLVSDQHEI
ncbi:DUF1398 domain-containing protein [Chitinophaga sedimenti]|uniref:DUF1398 domain-containing protein n=1 Tax=Chitinophaga sedimenti TaxID=2033606 RepID=UPI002002C2BE|nr:DUF1398 family protein [Chitinophaga sedimenti]MCK7555925.1 DUF1398 domain-containing protein [Chitinophaga sedimenti]